MKIISKDSTEENFINQISYQKEHPNFKSLIQELDSVIHLSQKKGYIDARKVKVKKEENTPIYIGVLKLGKFYPTTTIYINNADSLNHTFNLKEIKLKDSISIPTQEIEIFLSALNEEISNNGRPFAYINLSDIRKKKDKLIANLEISPSKRRTLDKITIKGYEKFPRSFLKNYLRLKTGKEFNKANINKKTKNLENLNFANQIRKPEVLFTSDSTTVFLYLEKQNSNSFDGFLGFSNSEDENNLQLNGHINLQLINNLNYGEELHIEYKNNGEEYSYFNAEVILPYLFNTPISIEASLNLSKQDSTFSNNTQEIQATYSLSPQIKISTGYKAEESNYLLEENQTSLGNYEDYNSNYFTAGITYKKTQNKTLIGNLSYIFLKTEIGKRETSITTNQQKYLFSGYHNFTLNRRNYIYIANNTGLLNSDNYLNNELFRTGGVNSIRGFQENSLIGNFYSFFNTEYRYILDQNLYAHSIIDFGKLENQNLNQTNDLISFGFGLGLSTKSGLFKLIFANGKTDSQNFEFRNTNVHLKLSTEF